MLIRPTNNHSRYRRCNLRH